MIRWRVARLPLIRAGEGPAGLDRLERERIAYQQKIDRICDECVQAPANGHALTKPGDLAALRGIPVLAKGVGAAMNHTRPDREVIRKISR